jgi:glutaminyl-peptide cyclotransferase
MTELDGIEHLVLLDLLGAPNPSIRSYFTDTAWLFDSLASAERRLHEGGVLMGSEGTGAFQSFFLPRRANEPKYGMVDDHIPFLRKGVSILHVIAVPYPGVWHTLRVSYELHENHEML